MHHASTHEHDAAFGQYMAGGPIQTLHSRLYKPQLCSEALNAIHGARCEGYVAVWLLLAGSHKAEGRHSCTKSFCSALSLLAEPRPTQATMH